MFYDAYSIPSFIVSQVNHRYIFKMCMGVYKLYADDHPVDFKVGTSVVHGRSASVLPNFIELLSYLGRERGSNYKLYKFQ